MNNICTKCEYADFSYFDKIIEHCTGCEGGSHYKPRKTFTTPRPLVEADFTAIKKGR